MYQLDGKVALVTGSGVEQGLGRAIALRLAAEGADVAIADLPGNEAGLASVAAEIAALGRTATAVTGDITSAQEVDQLVADTLEQFGKIDILVNNAGAPAGADRAPVVDLDEAAFDLVQAVNVKGTFLMSRAVARHMLERGGGGKIINMSSMAGKRGKARYAAYCASKFAVIGFTQSLASELGEHGIQVNVLCPGYIDNHRVLKIAEATKPEGVSTAEYHARMQAQFIASTPLGRLGTPDDVATSAAWLASAESDFITGQSINVNGGDWMG